MSWKQTYLEPRSQKSEPSAVWEFDESLSGFVCHAMYSTALNETSILSLPQDRVARGAGAGAHHRRVRHFA